MTIRAYQHNVQVLGGITITPGVAIYQHNIQVLGGVGPVALSYSSSGSVLLSGNGSAVASEYITYTKVKVRFKVE